MITFACDKCEQLLEVDDHLLGLKVECPYCRDINVVSPPAAGNLATARPAHNQQTNALDRAQQLGLPLDSGPEQLILTLHPAMFRARPLRALVLLLLIVGSITAAVLLGPAGQIGGATVIALSILWWIVWFIQSRMVALIITSKRSILRRGLFSRDSREVLHDRVQDIQIRQSFLQRLTNIGRIGLSSSGDSGIEIDVCDIPAPSRLREIIDAYRND